MRVLVTGASGMLGGAVAASLRARGDEVTTLQRRPTAGDSPHREVLGDVADPVAVAAAVRGQDAVLHLAAKVDVVGPPADYLRTNVHGTRTLLDAARRAGVHRFVHVSSPSVAHSGSALVGAPAGPADPSGAHSHYSRTKAIAERVALAADSEDLRVLAVRPHLVWGPGDTQLIGRIVDRARAGRLFVVGTGAALIDTTYVDDAADALVAAVDACGPAAHGEALVVTAGEPRPVADIVGRVCRAAGLEAPRRRVPVALARALAPAVEAGWAATRRPGTPPVTPFLVEQLTTAHWFDQRRARAVLGWQPAVGLDEGFRRLARWYATSA